MRVKLMFAVLVLIGPLGARAEEEGETTLDVSLEVEALKAPHPWAGTYHGFWTIDIAPSGRSCATSSSDMMPIPSSCGKLILEGDRFVADHWRNSGGPKPPFIRVPWGKRNYLVPEKEFLEFINAVNSGDEPRRERGGNAGYLRHEEYKAAVAGKPKVPAAYRPLLRAKPLVASAVEVSSRTISMIGDRDDDPRMERCKVGVRFDVGSSSGVFVGMDLHLVEDGWNTAEITAVTSGTATGTIETMCSEMRDISPGSRFSSRWIVR